MEDAQSWREPLETPVPPEMAAMVWELLRNQQNWIHRRVETIDILSGEMVKRSMSVDFTVPGSMRSALAAGRSDGYLVPLAMLGKERRRNFSVRDESGGAVPVLGQSSNGRIAAAALRFGVEFAAGERVSREAEVRLEKIVSHPGEESYPAIYEFLNEQFEGNGSELGWIFGDSYLTGMTAGLVNEYLLIAEVDDLSSRRVLKVSFEEIVGTLARRTLLESLGLRPLTMSIPVYGPESSTSYHVELVVPEELKFELVALRDRFTREPFAIERDVDRAALHTPWVDEQGDWTVVVRIRMERLGFPTQALLASSFTSAVLSAGLWAEAFSNSEMAPAVSLLLGGSAIVSGFGFSAGEHSLLRAIFFPLRLLLAISLVSALAAAAAVAFDLSESVSFVVWEVAAVASVLVTAILTVTLMRSAPLHRRKGTA